MSDMPPGYILVRPKMISEPKVVGKSEYTSVDGSRKTRSILEFEMGYVNEAGEVLYKFMVQSNVGGKIF
jgi:hypothetical protein